MTVADRVERVQARIAAAGGAGRVRLVAVTKGFGADAVRAVVAAGVADVGESYAQELVAKASEVGAPAPRWHFVGRLQTNKVRAVAPLVHLWQSVDRASLLDEVARRAPGAAVLVQVNVTGESQKGGCPPVDTGDLVARARDRGLAVAGLMAIGRAGDPEASRPGFRAVRRLAEQLGLEECSMGMTGDLEVAVEEGSTMVRVGTALFGERPDPRAARRRLEH